MTIFVINSAAYVMQKSWSIFTCLQRTILLVLKGISGYILLEFLVLSLVCATISTKFILVLLSL